MPKVADLKAYYRQMAVDAGFDEEKIKQVTAFMEDEKFAKVFTEKFKPLPDYSHDLDEVVAKTKANKDKEYADWYQKELDVYNANLAGIEKLKAYEAKYGKLDDTQTREFLNDQNRGGNMLTKEDIEKLKTQWETEMSTKLNNYGTASLEYAEAREDHLSRFRKPLDRKAFEAAYKEHPEWGTLENAYKNFIAPELDKQREADAKAEADRRYEEGVHDGASRRAVPSDSQPRSFSPMFDKDVKIEKMSEAEQEQLSRNSFFEGLAEKSTA
jgi:hypothetical protein